ncbi:hypothetical protein [Paenibacillus sp. 2KB_22]|uniref:hypothetical protein n=1 Tax=Paenibacillus sp. 2KB_22 TaxID=3232978 RepID=UPI003F9C2C88
MYSYNNITFFIERPGLAESIIQWESNGYETLYTLDARESRVNTENYIVTFGRIDTYYYLGSTSKNQVVYSAFPNLPMFFDFLHYGWFTRIEGTEEGLTFVKSIIQGL